MKLVDEKIAKLIMRVVRGAVLFLLVIAVTTAGLSPLQFWNDDTSGGAAALAPALKKWTDPQALPYLKAAKTYGAEFGLDPRLILAMIEQESQFQPDAVSQKGARGLMQIMPATSSEIAERFDGESDTTYGIGNIRAGAYYYSTMLALFRTGAEEDRLSIALAAYNAGPARIYDAQEIAAYMGEDPTKWSSIKNALPLLSKRYYSLHRLIWEGGRPRNGYFGDSRQTLAYVEGIMERYHATYVTLK